MVTCLSSANGIVSGLNATFNKFMSNITVYGFLKAVDTGLGVLYSPGGLSSACV